MWNGRRRPRSSRGSKPPSRDPVAVDAHQQVVAAAVLRRRAATIRRACHRRGPAGTRAGLLRMACSGRSRRVRRPRRRCPPSPGRGGWSAARRREQLHRLRRTRSGGGRFASVWPLVSSGEAAHRQVGEVVEHRHAVEPEAVVAAQFVPPSSTWSGHSRRSPRSGAHGQVDRRLEVERLVRSSTAAASHAAGTWKSFTPKAVGPLGTVRHPCAVGPRGGRSAS